jgi:hypothetical protein
VDPDNSFAAQVRALFSARPTTQAARVRGTRNFEPIVQAVVLLSLVLVCVPLVLGAGPQSVNTPAFADASTKAQGAPVDVKKVQDLSQMRALIQAMRSDKPITEDPFLSTGAQDWALVMSKANEVRHDPTLSDTVSEWKSLNEFVVVAPTLDAAYARLTAHPGQMSALRDPSVTSMGLGFTESLGQTFLVVRLGEASS